MPNYAISDILKNLTKSPGVYKFLDVSNNVIYVGKAKNLRNRVRSYFTGKKTDEKTRSLISNINDISIIIVETESDALLLENSLIKKYKSLLKTENVDLEFSDDGIDAIANIATEVNSTVENIGARRLHTIIERVLDEISFTATDRSGEKIVVDSKYIKENLGELVKDTDLSKFIL